MFRPKGQKPFTPWDFSGVGAEGRMYICCKTRGTRFTVTSPGDEVYGELVLAALLLLI